MISMENYTKLAGAYPVLAGLSSNLQTAFLQSSYPIQAGAGEVIFDTGDTIKVFLMLTRGSVRVIQLYNERELLLYRLNPGGCCAISISHLLGVANHRARALVERPVQGVAVPQELFQKLVDEAPQFRYFVYHAFCERFSHLLELIERVASRRFDERLARLLLSKGNPVNTTHEQLADELGTVREVISRILKDFEAEGLIKLERGQIRILDPESLQEIVQIRDSGHRQSQ